MTRFLSILLCFFLLCSPVLAASGVTSAQSQTLVASNGTCEVTMTVKLRLDAPDPELTFPLPDKARDITVNGASAPAPSAGSHRRVDLSGIVSAAGEYTLVFRYELPDTVTSDPAGNLTLKLELLSGFSYPVDFFELHVTLPGEFSGKPEFSSTYHQETIDTILQVSVSDGVITAAVPGGLKDNEVLSMTLPVSEEMFPQAAAKRWSMDTVDLMMLLCAGLALCYWLLTLRCLPPARTRYATPPNRFTPGEAGCQMTCAGVDFSLMVISWAQMGYLLIHLDDNGRVLLHKRMDMGNERSDFEVRYFRKLFGRRRLVDGTGYHYARLCRKANSHTPGVRMNYLRVSGNPGIFRTVCAVIGMLSGVSLAAAFASDTALRTVLTVLLGILGFFVAWQIQSAGKCIHLRDKAPLWRGLFCGGVWLLLSFLAGEWNVAAFVIPAQFVAGLAAAYGGRRTEVGKQTLAELLGLRRYLSAAPKKELRRLLRHNPDFFYQTALWALALGVDRRFAERFGNTRLPHCSFLTTGMDGHFTAPEWNQLLRETVEALDARQKNLPLDRLLGR